MQIAVIGRGDCSGEEYRTAETLGRLIAESGGTVCCGGLGGVMEAVSRGAKGGRRYDCWHPPGHRGR